MFRSPCRCLARRAWPWLAFLIGAAGAARADLGPPIDLEILGDPVPAEAGRNYAGTIRVTAQAEVAVAGFMFVASPAWDPLSLTDPGLVYLRPGMSVDLPFEVLAIDPSREPLVLDMMVDDHVFSYPFNLSPEFFAEGDVAQPTQTFTPDGSATPMTGRALPSPDPAPPADGTPVAPWFGAADSAAVTGADKSARWITVHGRFFYWRDDQVADGADGFTVQVFANNAVVASSTTDAHGFFNFQVYWPSAADPDLRVEYVADNARVQVRNPGNKVMRWGTGTWTKFAGTDLDAGWRHPSSLDHHVYVHGFTVLNRAWRWILADAGVDWTKVSMRREMDGGPWYEASKKLIHCNTKRMWLEITVVHEVGHHFLQWHAAGVGGPHNYCNGVCDETTTKCSHCTWCLEDAEDGWNEGFPTWLGTMVIADLPGTYGVMPYNTPDFEHLYLCTEQTPAVLDDPLRNEGPFVALLHDIVDADNEDDTLTPSTAGWSDKLTLGTGPIWDVVWQDAPLTPQQFLDGFLANNGSLRRDIWETARNNGYETDTQPPPVPFLFSSTSHTAGVASADATIDLYWAIAQDDASGIAGYSLTANLDSPLAPDYLVSCGDVGNFTTINLPPGNWYFTIRSLDRAGHWSPGYATWGPAVIAAPAQVQLQPTTVAGWAHPVVPHPAPDASAGNVPAPTALTGGADTWWNLAVANRGTAATSGDVRLALRVDGQEVSYTTIRGTSPLAGGASNTFLDRGPVQVFGGRHAFGVWADALESQAETNEDDNHWAWQWLWEAAEITAGMPLPRTAPPLATGGWENLAGGAGGPNADAVRMRVPTQVFHGLYLFARNNGDDYDLSLHAPSNDPQSGLDTFLATSSRLAGFLDAVLVHAVMPHETLYDAAINNYSGTGAEAVIAQVAAADYGVGSQTALAFGQDDMLKLGVVHVMAGQEGPLTLRLTANPAEGPLHVLWYGGGYFFGDLNSWAAYARTGDDGTARLDVTTEAAVDHHFAIYRDPKGGTQPRAATLEILATLPDATPVTPAGWYAPLVPRALPDGTPADVLPPVVLAAAPVPTFFNAAVFNASPAAFPPNPCLLLIDGETAATINFPVLAAHATGWVNDTAGIAVAGGRHTAGMRLDPDGLIPEMDESNNGWARQWTWEPPAVAPGSASFAAYPPNPVHGWPDIRDPGAFGLAWNCLGWRIVPAPGRDRTGQWFGVYAMPAAGEDVDVQLHEASTGAEDGFASPLAFSGWGPDACDYALVNLNRTAPRPFDAALLRGSGLAAARVQVAASTFLGTNPTGATSAFALPAVQGLALHEVWLDPGIWVIQLENLDGQADYGLTLHAGNLAYQSKSNAVPQGSSWAAGPGQDEWITVTIDEARYACLAVWKRSPADLPLAGSYRLHFETGLTPAGPAPVAVRTALTGAQPNPFNPRVTIDYTLRESGPVDLGVYDLRGRRVRRLVSGELPAGGHRAVWDGVGDDGQRAASGAYLLRLVGPGGVTDQRRVTMIK